MVIRSAPAATALCSMNKLYNAVAGVYYCTSLLYLSNCGTVVGAIIALVLQWEDIPNRINVNPQRDGIELWQIKGAGGW
jgi:hypothetical protein